MAASIGRGLLNICKEARNPRFRKLLPALQPTRQYAIMDDDGDVSRMRTSVNILNQEEDAGIFIDAYSSHGFRLNSGIRIMGPCAVFPRSILHWNIKGIEDINENSLGLFTMLEPKIDILVIGVGERSNLSRISPKIIQYLKLNRINAEILPTDQALATFNFLNSENRYVAGAFVPPSYVELAEDEIPYTNLVKDPNLSFGDPFSSHIPSEDGVLAENINQDRRSLVEKIHDKVSKGKSLEPKE